jgi:transcriptional regulator with XRE-family HTH domain
MPTAESNDLGRIVRAIRRRRGWTQRELAEIAGVSTSYIVSLENGRRGRRPTPSVVRRLAHAFEMDPVDLIDPPASLAPRKSPVLEALWADPTLDDASRVKLAELYERVANEDGIEAFGSPPS